MTCVDCGASGARTRDGLCVACMLALALHSGSARAADDADDASLDATLLEHAERVEQAPEVRTPDVPDDYVLLERIGAGGMGTVWKATQRSTQRVVALKFLRAPELDQRAARRHFVEEARAAARLRHPHIVSLYELREHRGSLFLAMEYIRGHTLAERVVGQALTPHEAARSVRSVAEGLAYAHAQSVVHLDVKPQNVLLDEHGVPYLADFGLARRLDAQDSLTLSENIRGTPSYMAPEQLVGGGTSTALVDVYGLGATLYHCLTGRAPFRGHTVLETLHAVRESEPLPPRTINAMVPHDLQTICLRCLHKDPARRYPSAQALVDDLTRFLAGEPIVARPEGLRARALRRLGRDSLLAVFTLGAVAVLCFLALIAWWLREDRLDSAVQSARLAAGAVHAELEDLGRAVASEARGAALIESMQTADGAMQRRLLAAALASPAHRGGGFLGFRNWHLLDASGKTLAAHPMRGPRHVDRSHRDYYRGPAARVARGEPDRVHYSRVYHSVDDQLHKFAMTHVVRGPHNEVLGYLSAMLGTRSIERGPFRSAERMSVLVAQTDRASPGAADEAYAPYVIMLHPAYRAYDVPVPIAHPLLPALLSERASTGPSSDRDAAYRDPVATVHARYLGSWLAGLARVPQTPFVVIFQVRDWVTNALLGAALVGLLGTALAWWRTLSRRAR